MEENGKVEYENERIDQNRSEWKRMERNKIQRNETICRIRIGYRLDCSLSKLIYALERQLLGFQVILLGVEMFKIQMKHQ